MSGLPIIDSTTGWHSITLFLSSATSLSSGRSEAFPIKGNYREIRIYTVKRWKKNIIWIQCCNLEHLHTECLLNIYLLSSHAKCRDEAVECFDKLQLNDEQQKNKDEALHWQSHEKLSNPRRRHRKVVSLISDIYKKSLYYISQKKNNHRVYTRLELKFSLRILHRSSQRLLEVQKERNS